MSGAGAEPAWQEFTEGGARYRVAFHANGRRTLQEHITRRDGVAYWREINQRLFPTRWKAARLLKGRRKAA